MKKQVPTIHTHLTAQEKNALGTSPASDGVLGKSINPGVKKFKQLL